MSSENNIVVAHGVLAVLAWVVFFPLGAILVRLLSGPSTWLVHATIQSFAMAIFTAAVGLGLQVATSTDQLNEYHPIIGLVLFAIMFFQAAGGSLHHIMFKKQHRRTAVSHAHLWLGRAIITLGMINGGLGLLLNADGTDGEYIAYGVITALIWVAWVSISVFGEVKKSRGSETPPSMVEVGGK